VTDASKKIQLAAALITANHAPKKPSRALALSAIIAVVGIAVGAALTMRAPAATDVQAGSARPAPAAMPVAPSEPVAPPPVAPQKPTAAPIANTFRIRVGVEPASATVTLDGSQLEMPFSAELTRDGKLHDVEASADGYVTQKFSLPFDRDRELDIVLEPAKHHDRRVSHRREQPEPAAAEAAPAPAPAPVKPAEPFPDETTQQRRIKRNIDTNDPWAQ
jgi:hypothetical protein